MSKFVCALAALLIFSHEKIFAEDLDDVVTADPICKTRPDLCEEVEVDDDGNPIEPAPRKTAAKKRAPAARKTATAEPTKRRCRVRGQNYSLADAEMPYCAMTPAQQKAAAIARAKANGGKKPAANGDEDRFESLYAKKPAAGVKPVARTAIKPAAGLSERAPASVVAAKGAPPLKSAAAPAANPTEPSGPAVTFQSYLKSNSVHPAMAMKINNRQTAFVEVSRPAVIGIQLKEEPDAPTPTVLGTPVQSTEKPGPVAPPPQGY